MARSQRALSRRGRPPSLSVAARRTSKLQQNVRDLLNGLEDLEKRLLRLDILLEANRKLERERARVRSANHRGIRGKGPNVRDVAFQIPRAFPSGLKTVHLQLDVGLRIRRREFRDLGFAFLVDLLRDRRRLGTISRGADRREKHARDDKREGRGRGKTHRKCSFGSQRTRHRLGL